MKRYGSIIGVRPEKLEEYKKWTKDKNKDEVINKAREIKNKYTVSKDIGEQINLFLNSF